MKKHPCDCPKTDVELAEAVMSAKADKLIVCDDAYANLLKLTFGADATAAKRPSFVMHQGNPLASSTPVPEITVRPGKAH